MRKKISRDLSSQEVRLIRNRLSAILSTEESACFLDSCDLAASKDLSKYDFIAAWGEEGHFQFDSSSKDDAFKQLQNYHDQINDWIFGVMSYDLKNNLHPQLSSSKQSDIELPLLSFFQPTQVVYVQGQTLYIESLQDPEDVLSNLDAEVEYRPQSFHVKEFKSSISKENYFATIQRIKDEIRDGNVYELNYCLNHRMELSAGFNSIDAFHRLKTISPAPFAAYFQHNKNAVIGASPERYLSKKGSKLFSQPIKGTKKRGTDEKADLQLKMELQNSLKERAENVMIVDLVRNDLAHTCKPGSVLVSELFGIYSYEQVHQMVSTVEGTLEENQNWTEAIRHSFPMGSMTGAPKIAAMKIIDEIEDFSRGWYSGSVGYVTPSADFDFNVIIRSLVYNGRNNELSYAAGGAITYDSTAEEEWNECQLKAAAIRQLLTGSFPA